MNGVINGDLSVLAYVLQVKVEMELEIQQYEKAKAMREEQLDRLTQICQEQAVCLVLFLLTHVMPLNNQQRRVKSCVRRVKSKWARK